MAVQPKSRLFKIIRFRRKFLRPLLLGIVGLAITAEIVFLSPSDLEESKATPNAVDPSTLIMDNEPSVVPGVPQGRIAEYSIEKFKYVSIQNGEKQWRIEANKAFMYNPERLVHARTVEAYLYDPEGKVTIIKGKEARYFLNKKDLEVYGDVKTVFPDGFELYSDYLRYKPGESRIIIPTTYPVHGSGHENADQIFHFKSLGLDYLMGDAKITLPQAAVVTLERVTPQSTDTTGTSGGVPDQTIIESDHCFIDRNKNMAHFTMDPLKPLKTRFVHITQPTLFTRSRWADLNYGSFNQVLNYLIAYDDVLVKEIPTEPTKEEGQIGKPTEMLTGKPKTKSDKNEPPPPLRYATAGHAEFDTQHDIIVLTEFPQAYQEQDTVTGDIILLHRDSDIVEVEHSNAFSRGE